MQTIERHARRQSAALQAQLAVVLALTVLLTGCQGEASPGVTTLVYASPYSPNHPFSRADEAWMQWVEGQSHGRLRIRPLWSATLLSSEESMTELRHGVADIGLITPIYERGGEQLIRIQTAFYAGTSTIDQQIALYRCLAQTFPAMRRELHGLHILAVQGGALPGVLTRSRPVHALADLRGLRIRAPTELLGVLKDLGADPVDMPMDQVYSELAKGILDGVIAPADTLRSLHFAEVAKFYWELEIPRGAYPARAMSERRWLALSDTERALLTASTPVWEAAMAREIERSVRAGFEFGEQHGVRFTPATTEQQRAFNVLYERDAERSAAGLARYGIDGLAVLRYARRFTAGIEAGGRGVCSAGVSAALM